MKYAAIIVIASALNIAVLFTTIFPAEGGVVQASAVNAWPPLPMFKPTIGADVPVEVAPGTTERHADCFDAADDAVLLACLTQVDTVLYSVRSSENGR